MPKTTERAKMKTGGEIDAKTGILGILKYVSMPLVMTLCATSVGFYYNTNNALARQGEILIEQSKRIDAIESDKKLSDKDNWAWREKIAADISATRLGVARLEVLMMRDLPRKSQKTDEN
jgi:hypothetical protein